MNTADEIRQAFADYQRTQFGGWPWKLTDPVHGPTGARFARFIDGHTERPGCSPACRTARQRWHPIHAGDPAGLEHTGVVSCPPTWPSSALTTPRSPC
jgi:hypothetical protein